MRGVTIALAVVFVATLATAQDRRCAGHDPVTAERERTRARESLERALRRPRYVDPEALHVAITAATTACEAGEDRGLALRAAALRARADFVDAARDLDAYLARHPLATHTDREVQDFLRELAASLDAIVARVRVIRGPFASARVVVNDLALDDAVTAVAVAPGPVHVLASREGYASAELTLSVAAGATTTLTLREDTAAGPNDLVLRRSAAVVVPMPVASPSHPLRPWAISATAATGVLLAVGAGFAVWRESAASSYRAPGCESMAPPSAACVSAYGNFLDANAATIGTFATAGAFALGAGVLWFLDLRRPGTRAFGCSPALGGVACAVRF